MIIYTKCFLSDRKSKEVLKRMEEGKKAGKDVKIQTFKRRFIDRFSCVDTPEKPYIIKNFWIAGEIIYIKSGFNYKTIAFNDLLQVEII